MRTSLCPNGGGWEHPPQLNRMRGEMFTTLSAVNIMRGIWLPAPCADNQVAVRHFDVTQLKDFVTILFACEAKIGLFCMSKAAKPM